MHVEPLKSAVDTAMIIMGTAGTIETERGRKTLDGLADLIQDVTGLADLVRICQRSLLILNGDEDIDGDLDEIKFRIDIEHALAKAGVPVASED